MREIDPRSKVTRRVFLRNSATAAPAAAALAAGLTIGADAAWAQSAKNLKPATLATLARLARDLYPHDQLADTFYIKAISGYDAKSGTDAAFKKLMEDGVAALDAAATAKFKSNYLAVGWEEQRVSLLQAIEKSAFFQKVRGDLIVGLYNNPEVWAKFRYEGESASKGGYINRGFNDIDWLKA